MTLAETIIISAHLISKGYPDDFVEDILQAMKDDEIDGVGPSLAFKANILAEAIMEPATGILGKVITHAMEFDLVSKTSETTARKIEAIKQLQILSETAASTPLNDRIAFRKINDAVLAIKQGKFVDRSTQ